MLGKNFFDLTEKVVVLTGAAGRLGREYANSLSEFGANVVLADLDYDSSQQLVKLLKQKFKTEPFAIKVDLSDQKSVKKMTSQIIKKYSHIDVLINNAMFSENPKDRITTFEKYSLSSWNNAIGVNLTGILFCCQEICPIMAKQKYGNIINISSIYGMVGSDQRIYGKSKLNSSPVYAVTKGALLNFTRYLASYWHMSGIRVNSLSLGGVKDNQDKQFIKNYSNKTMIGRMARKDDYNGAIIFLSSDASSYMTGSNLVIDGGWTAW